MKKITSLMMMMVLCCIGAFAQATDLEGKIVKIGTVQADMVPGKWYFLHCPRNPDQQATDFAVPVEDEAIKSVGGLVADQGIESALKLSTTAVLDELNSDEGASANDHMNKFVRFVAAKDAEGAYNIQFGTGNWLAGDPGNGTVSNNSYLGGLAGKYNFYLVNINGAPNQAGRFGWNQYNMAKRIDNNGAGNTVVFWGEGVREAGDNELDPADGSSIKGNNIWQIFDVEVLGDEDPYESAFNALLNTVIEITSRENYINDLLDDTKVGSSYGNYRPEDVAAFMEIHNKLEELIAKVDEADEDEKMNIVKNVYPTVEDLKAEHERYKAADKKVTSNKVPLAVTDIAPGYYTINSVLKWMETKVDTIYYTQEEADEINTMGGYTPGDEGYVTPDSIKETQSSQVEAPIKALRSLDYDGNGWLAWGKLESNSQFLWKIEKVEGKPSEYRLINMYRGHTCTNIGTSYNMMLVEDDTITMTFDYRGVVTAPVINKEVVAYSIRATYGSEGENGFHCIHCGGHNGGTGSSGWVLGWSADAGASQWYLAPVDDETADLWINGAEAQVRKMVNEANLIAKNTPAQFEIAKDLEGPVAKKASQFYSQYSTNDAQSIPNGKTVYDFLIDGNQSTYWHSRWEDGDQPFQKHYLQISAEEPLDGMYNIKITRRPVDGDHITQLAVKGYTEAPTDETTFEEGTDLATLDLPFTANDETLTSAEFDATGYRYLRFYSLATQSASNGSNCNRGYWHASEFNVYRVNQRTTYEKTQYQVREEIINRLQAAMDVWNAGEYSEENGDLINDEAFVAAYNELIAASEAWKAVYVNPAALRAAIAAAPAENIFVIGNNPGQWKEGSVTPAATVNEAKAYDESCTYTPAESERLIKAIADVTAQAYASANKVQTGKWYRIKFPTEEMYDTYKWSKTGAQATHHEITDKDQYLALFGKTIAAGKSYIEYVPFKNAESNADTLATYRIAAVEESFNGQNLCFFDEEQIADINEGDDLFRFIQATDTSYIIQNKSTGLFLRGDRPVALSDVPTYFYTKAVGAGANIITYTNVLGEKAQHCNLHGERSTNLLTCWEANSIGSNSALLIEEAEDVTEEPATAYSTKLWPGSVYAYTKPVDVTIAADAEAVAYGAELEIGNADGDTAIVLKKIAAETIKAGTPFILIANETHDEYINPADRLAQIAAEVTADEGKYGYYEKQIAAELRDGEYVAIEMDHGMAVDTLQKGNGDLVGTFRNLTVAAGKGIVTKDNGFAHTLINTTVGANGAYIKCDFDPESTDVLGTIKVDIDGSIETGITDALDKVAKSGNIYTVDGKLVGKGNINAINNLPAGIYIVNGVKVTKN